MEQFFIVVPPGSEKAVVEEIEQIWCDLLSPSAQVHDLPLPEFQFHKGGLEFETEIMAALQLHFFLKIPSRILWRLNHFRCRDFPKFFSRMKAFDWKKRTGGQAPRFEISAQKSRLNNEKRLHETLCEAWGLSGKDPEAGPCFYLRVIEDEVTLSLDLTGEHLHRRGLLLERGEAPLRESLAARCLFHFIEGRSPTTLSQVRLVDPMAGSGTFLLEAATLWSPLFLRRFAFQELPVCPKLLRSELFPFNYKQVFRSPFASYEARELDPKMVSSLKRNWEGIRRMKPSLQPPPSFHAEVEDLLTSPSPSPSIKRDPSIKTWVICNPPYGFRLESAEGAQKILEAILQKWAPDRVGLLLPTAQARGLRWPQIYQGERTLAIKNGGLDCLFLSRERSEASASSQKGGGTGAPDNEDPTSCGPLESVGHRT